MEQNFNKKSSSGTRLLEISKNLTRKDILATGSEKRLYNHPEDPKKAIRKYMNEKASSPTRLKHDFYLSKILHMLYPKNFPDIHAVLPSHALDVVEKIKRQSYLSDLFLSGVFSLKTIYLAKKIGVDLDTVGRDNFILDKKFNAKYVDTPELSKPKLLRKSIMEKLKGEERELALKYLENYEKEWK